MMEFHGVLFVCRANICRSPMAESMFGVLARERGLSLRVGSAGVEARPGFDMAPRTRTVLEELGFPAGEHRSRAVSGGLLKDYDLVLTMTRRHSEALLGLEPGAEVMTLPEFAGDAAEPDISDPYRLTVHAYRATARRVLGYVEAALDTMQQGVDRGKL
ncbi:low molecular weight protein arginine phosphatase [Rubrobacter indicoceani]|uniref:arsenate reductase/protein-tyrosine-phosphatase family protein n=1 Tax=Rubrobacter indicoceani TaxID=2051957 RepID=UPI000E5A9200|nr:low molecular weight protein arginine phosphatase [Rubrobacter indicoceani]